MTRTLSTTIDALRKRAIQRLAPGQKLVKDRKTGNYQILDSRGAVLRDNVDLEVLANQMGQRGFSLIELLIVVAIILIIAAIAIPRLLSARTTAVEGRAASTLRTVSTGLVGYNTKFGVFPAALSNLGGAACDTTAPMPTAGCQIDDTLATTLATGAGQYVYTYTTTGGTFTINSDPAASSSAHRHYYEDSALVIHYNDTAAASAADPTL